MSDTVLCGASVAGASFTGTSGMIITTVAGRATGWDNTHVLCCHAPYAVQAIPRRRVRTTWQLVMPVLGTAVQAALVTVQEGAHWCTGSCSGNMCAGAEGMGCPLHVPCCLVQLQCGMGLPCGSNASHAVCASHTCAAGACTPVICCGG